MKNNTTFHLKEFNLPEKFRIYLFSVAFGTTASSALGFLIDIVAVNNLGAGAFEVGLLNTTETVCYLFLSLPVGALVERSNKAVAMVLAEAITAVSVVCLCVGLSTQTLDMPLLLLTTFVVGLSTMVFGIASSSLVPGLVSMDNVEVAVAKQRGIATSTGVIVPSAAGQLLALVTMPLLLLFSAFCSVISAFFLWKVRTKTSIPNGHPVGRKAEASVFAAIVEGVRSAVADKEFLVFLGATAFMNFGLAWSNALQVPFFIRDLSLGPRSIGLIYSASAVGALFGTIIAPRVISRLGGPAAIKIATIVALPAVVLFPLSAAAPWPVAMLVTHASLYGAAVAVFNIALYGWVARQTPQENLARRFSFMGFIAMGVVPIGAISGGVFADTFGNGASSWIWCLTSAASCALATLTGPTLARRMKRNIHGEN